MKVAQIVHNPTAGNGGHTRKDLMDLLKGSGYDIEYVSTSEDDWKNFFRNEPDVVFLGGGDGTVHKLAGALKEGLPKKEKPPIHLLPLGTANNIARTLEMPTDPGRFSVNLEGRRKFNLGRIKGIREQEFFLESAGFGIFPELISQMEKNKIEGESSSEKLKRTIKVLQEVVRNFETKKTELEIKGNTIQGSFLMVELMNIKYIGPNLKLAPNADPGDGSFDLVIIPEENRAGLEAYLNNLVEGKKDSADINKFVRTISVEKLKMRYDGPEIHVDDDLVEQYKGKSFTVEVEAGALEFITVA